MRSGLFITGTDTGIGKTVISSLILSSLRSHGFSRGYFKPVQTGPDSDTGTVQTLASLENGEWVPPRYFFPEPIAPSEAAEIHQSEIQVSSILATYLTFAPKPWVIEGAGGLLSPLSKTATIRELIQAFKIPMLLVTSCRLGTLNQTFLTLEAAEKCGISVHGIVITGTENPKLEESLSHFTKIPVLARVPVFSPLTPNLVSVEGAKLFLKPTLSQIFSGGLS